MFFLIKKWIAYFFQPLTITFILLGIGIYFLCKKEPNIKRAKQFIIGGSVFLFLMCWPTFTYWMAVPVEQNYDVILDTEGTPEYEYIHCLGSGHADNHKLPANIRIGSQGLSRVTEAVRLHKLYPNSKIIFSGYGGPSKDSFAKIASEAAKIMGVSEDNIILLPKAKDTIDESKGSFKIIDNKPFLLVSEASHLRRSLGLFTKLGMKPTPAPSSFLNSGKWHLSLPSRGGLKKADRSIYEAMGITWAWLTGRL